MSSPAINFLAIDHSAAEEIVASRVLQSTEFEPGETLAAFLQNPILDVNLGPRLMVKRCNDGVFLLGLRPAANRFVVVDLENSGMFDGEYLPEVALLDAQKLLRFAIKVWGKLRFSFTELFVPDTTKAIIFPHPISQQTKFRISVELRPDAKRQAKRAPDDRSMLVYRAGYDEGGGPQEEAPVRNFRQFLEAKKAILAEVESPKSDVQRGITSLAVTTLDTPVDHPISPYQGFEHWLQVLTHKQKTFVLADLRAPHRIEGPAGTGKTLSLVLKAIAGLRAAEQAGREHRALFITHSEATRRTVNNLIEVNDQWGYLEGRANLKLQSLQLSTLQQLCGELLQRDLSDAEFLDRDAMESKQLQALHVQDALETTMAQDFETYKKLLSAGFVSFLSSTDRDLLSEMFRHEISVVIKGRADENIENYRKLPRLKYGLPTAVEADRNFVWLVFRKYQTQLQEAGQFDTDDIVLTTIGQLNTPIWRRRRTKEGFDALYIDETHLFNVNELSIFHHLSRSVASAPIAYSVDRAQAVGDHGWEDESFDVAFGTPEGAQFVEPTQVQKIFRCSPEIVDLAFSVTSCGATLFTNFHDPMRLASSAFTSEEERKCAPPCLLKCGDDDQMIEEAFRRADAMADGLQSSRCDVAVIVFSDELLAKATNYARAHNKPVEILKRRGDTELIRKAQQTKRLILSAPDFVGGLEFAGVVLVGIDEGRVPPIRTAQSVDSSNFASYAAHNRLYIAITRAKYRVEVLIAKERDPSSLLLNAIQNRLLGECEP
jgi:superfamily I DNA/RNA helicase